jgi:hypothetical protein
MADRGMGIRIFNSKEQLQEIFEGFESDEESDGDSEGQAQASDTAVVTSQLRHFVVQVASLASQPLARLNVGI